jgi:hypothetical protein
MIKTDLDDESDNLKSEDLSDKKPVNGSSIVK